MRVQGSVLIDDCSLTQSHNAARTGEHSGLAGKARCEKKLLPFGQGRAIALLILALVFAAQATTAQQAPSVLAPDERFKTDVLLVVAHPDDETAISGYLARIIFDQQRRVAVVFATRGDAGGNSAGYEQAAALGAIREIEARRALASFGVLSVWFLGAPDTAGQDVLRSLETWRHGAALEQLVRLVRLTRPEVILTWLPVCVAGENHGDHQAAGVIATEAFDLAGSPVAFPSQVSPPRDRTSINNLTEGLRPWQPKKIYFFSDASHFEFMDAKGPMYATTDVSPSKNVPYYRLSADEWTNHRTQGEVAAVAKRAIDSGDFKELTQPERFVLGKSLVKSSTTGDVFDGISAEPLAFVPVKGYKPESRSGLTLELGGPWSFYRGFWKAHDVDHLATLLTPEISVGVSQSLTVPLVIRNDSDQTVELKLITSHGDGWSERARFSSFTVPARSSYPLQSVLTPKAHVAKGWHEVTWTLETAGKTGSSITLRVFLVAGGLPQ